MEYHNLDDPRTDFHQRVQKTSNWFKNVEVSVVIVKEKGKNLLIDGKAVFIYKDDENEKEVTHDYGNVVLARRILEIGEFLALFPSEPNDILDIKDLKSLFLGKNFNPTVYQMPSNTEYLGMIHDWPVRVYYYGGDHNTSFDSRREFLVKLHCPSFPNLQDARNSFLEIEHEYHDNHISGLKIVLPDYSARIKTVEISEKNISVEIESREIKQEQLILKINARRDKKYFLPEDIPIDKNIILIKIPFEAKTIYIFLMNKNSEEILDYIEYGNYMTERHRGIIIKTSSELIETLIIKGENKSIEFKRQMSNEFLESVVAFSNTDGGRVILGIDNRKNIVGIHDDFDTLEKRIRNTIHGMIQPQIEVNVEQVEVQQSPLVIVTIPEGKNKPYLLDGKAYIRNNEADVSMGRSELDAIYNSKQSSDRDSFGIGRSEL